MKCTKCKGTGEVTWTLTEHGTNNKTEIPRDCDDCGGSGQVSAEDLKYIEAENNMWCECEGDTDATYHDDYSGAVYNGLIKIEKHHWSCTTCNLVKQIG